MRVGDFLHSKRWKLMQNYIYSWGASVVLIGALFKLEHLPGSGVFLGVGLSIEAIIFFISAFEPLLELPDWKTIYPQLRTGEEKERELRIYKKADEQYQNFFGSGGNGSGGGSAIANLPEEQIQELKKSFEKLSMAANGISDISSATKATSTFVSNLNKAADSIGSVVEANSRVSEAMDSSVQEISQSYKSVAKKMVETVESSSKGINGTLNVLSEAVTKSSEGIKSSSEKVANEMEKSTADFVQKIGGAASELNNSYKEMTSSLTSGFKGLEKSSSNYAGNLDQLNKNLSAINTAYELHLKGTAKVDTMVNEYAKSVGDIGKLLSTSVEQAELFNKGTKEINENIQALNTIYGRMLGALNGNK